MEIGEVEAVAQDLGPSRLQHLVDMTESLDLLAAIERLTLLPRAHVRARRDHLRVPEARLDGLAGTRRGLPGAYQNADEMMIPRYTLRAGDLPDTPIPDPSFPAGAPGDCYLIEMLLYGDSGEILDRSSEFANIDLCPSVEVNYDCAQTKRSNAWVGISSDLRRGYKWETAHIYVTRASFVRMGRLWYEFSSHD
jgi:hypothetical protein